MISVVPGTGTGAAESLSSLNRSTCREESCSCVLLLKIKSPSEPYRHMHIKVAAFPCVWLSAGRRPHL